MVKIDPYNTKERYLAWKEKALREGVKGVSKANSDIIIRYLSDLERGVNLPPSSKKGPRSFIRVQVLRIRLAKLAREFEKRFKANLTDISENNLCDFFFEMRNGTILNNKGLPFKASRDLAKSFKSFWHWHQRINRKEGGKDLRDITIDLDTSGEKPDWVYLTEEQIRLLATRAKYEYQVLIWFLFDTGIRAPTELCNIRVSDLYNDCKELNIRNEISKTFGRRIKLMICPQILRDYIKIKKLTSQDYLFKISPPVVNRYFRRLALKVLGDKESPAGQKYSDLTMYDFRHCSCCYWLPRYKSESALKYRFGWKKSDKIHYYSELLGMSDTISEEDMLLDITKTEIEKQLDKSEKENSILKDQLEAMQFQLTKITELTGKLMKNSGGHDEN